MFISLPFTGRVILVYQVSRNPEKQSGDSRSIETLLRQESTTCRRGARFFGIEMRNLISPFYGFSGVMIMVVDIGNFKTKRNLISN